MKFKTGWANREPFSVRGSIRPAIWNIDFVPTDRGGFNKFYPQGWRFGVVPGAGLKISAHLSVLARHEKVDDCSLWHNQVELELPECAGVNGLSRRPDVPVVSIREILEPFATGPPSSNPQPLLNILAPAHLCLLNTEVKTNYHRQQKRQQQTW